MKSVASASVLDRRSVGRSIRSVGTGLNLWRPVEPSGWLPPSFSRWNEQRRSPIIGNIWVKDGSIRTLLHS